MPIKGLTDRAARFPRLGAIRKGGERPSSGKAPGKDLDYFRLDTQDEEIAVQFKALYGEQPKSLPVFFANHETEDNFPCWMEEWTANSLKRRCDSETQQIWLEGNTYFKQPKPCEAPACKCKQVGRLQLVLPALKRLGYFELQTHSKWDILGINESLEAIYQALGTLRGVPFILSRREREISVPMEQKRVRTRKSLLHIEIEPQWSQRTMSALSQGVAQQLGSVNSSELRTIESPSALTETTEVAPYTTWAGVEDAITWGMAELDCRREEVAKLLDSVEAQNGKKAVAFYHAVLDRQEF